MMETQTFLSHQIAGLRLEDGAEKSDRVTPPECLLSPKGKRPVVKILNQYESPDGTAGSVCDPVGRQSPPPPPPLPPPDPTSSAKIIVVGNAKCGKSSLIRRYAQREFSPVYDMTYGADYTRRDVVIRDVGNKVVCCRLQMWDIAGQDRFAKLTRAYFNNASGAVIVCDVTRRNTMLAVKAWKDEIDRCLGPELPVILFANKSDCVKGGRSTLSIGAECERICTELGLFSWFFACAKDGDNVDDGFNQLVREILRNRRENCQEHLSSSGDNKNNNNNQNNRRNEDKINLHRVGDQKRVTFEEAASDCKIL